MSRAALFIVHVERDRRARRGDARTVLPHHLITMSVRRFGEYTVEHELLRADGEWRRADPAVSGDRSQSKAVDESVREPRGRLREGQSVLDEHEMPWALWAWERVDVG